MKLAIVLLTICFIAWLFYRLYQTVINFDPYEAKQKTTPEDPTEDFINEPTGNADQDGGKCFKIDRQTRSRYNSRPHN